MSTFRRVPNVLPITKKVLQVKIWPKFVAEEFAFCGELSANREEVEVIAINDLWRLPAKELGN